MAFRIYKKFLINLIKWLLLIGTVYIVFVSLTPDSGKEKRKELAKHPPPKRAGTKGSGGISVNEAKGLEFNEDGGTSYDFEKHSSKNKKKQKNATEKKFTDLETEPHGINVVNDDFKKEEKIEIDNQDAIEANVVNDDYKKAETLDVDNEGINEANVDNVPKGNMKEPQKVDMMVKNGEQEVNTYQPPCPNIKFPKTVLEKRWQEVDDSSRVYLYSAYYLKADKSVHIIGLRTKDTSETFCQVWGGESKTARKMVAETQAQPTPIDPMSYRYSASIFRCQLETEDIPSHVSLVTGHCRKPLNILRVQPISNTDTLPKRLTVCLSPNVASRENPANFIRWIEINRQLGVEKFVAYNFSTDANMTKVFRWYARKGVILVSQWRPPVLNKNLPTSTLELQGYGMHAALNDCLFKSKRLSAYITNLAYNEYIIPRGDAELSSVNLLKSLKSDTAVHFLRKAVITDSVNAARKVDPKAKKQKKIVISAVDLARKTLLIRTPYVNFTFPSAVPGVSSFTIPPEVAVIHRHLNASSNQVLGNSIEDVLPKNVMELVNTRIQNVLDEVKTMK